MIILGIHYKKSADSDKRNEKHETSINCQNLVKTLTLIVLIKLIIYCVLCIVLRII